MKHISYIKKKPKQSGIQSVPDGAITGNGDLSVILGNCENGMRLYIAKCDLWYANEVCHLGGIRPLGYIDIPVDKELYDNYHVEQDADNAKINCIFANDERRVEINIIVFKTENSIYIEKIGDNGEQKPVLKCVENYSDGSAGEKSFNGVSMIYRELGEEKNYYKTSAYASVKEISDNEYYVYASTNHDCENPITDVIEHISSADSCKIENLKRLHGEEWRKFWSKSSVSLSDKTLENGWYHSIFLLAVCTGNKKFPPGLFGNFITVENPMWKGDYHLNYNYQAPFYSACSSNHVELTDCYHAPLEEFIENGKKFASVFGCRGILYPVGIQPKGYVTEYQPDAFNPFLRLFLGQKSNAVHAADIMVFRWKSTRDTEYAEKHAYPYIKLCLEFFEDYCTEENGKFCVCMDSVHEVPMYKHDYADIKYKKYINDKNNLLTLGALRMCLECGIDMARSLGIDEDKQEIWQNMLDNLAPFPVYFRKFRRVFRYTEKGQAWHPDNTLGIQHIYPMGCINLNSDKKTLRTAKNSILSTYRWEDGNGTNSVFPAAIRIGMKPELIIKMLRLNISKYLQPNMLFNRYGAALENVSLIPNVINEMALQSIGGILRFFPVWDRSVDCEFSDLRADGAFLVSGSFKNGKIGKISVYSEKGNDLTYVDPRDGKTKTVKTSAGERIVI